MTEPSRTSSGPTKIMISADMEGVTGVTWTDDVLPGTEQWQRFRQMLTGDVNAAVAGLCLGGADSVLVNEAHLSQRNLLLEELDTRARLLTGRDRKSTRLNSSHVKISYAVFCLKKKKQKVNYNEIRSYVNRRKENK